MFDAFHRRSVLQLLGAAAAFAAAPTTTLAQSSRQTVVMLLPGNPPNLAAYLHSSTPTSLVATKIYDGLLEYDFDRNPQPGLAESWSVSEDGKTIGFKLRQGVTFHDGKPFTSADVKFSVMEVLKKYNARGPIIYRDLVDVETPDDFTAIFKLSNPAPYLMMALSGYESPIVPKHLFEGTDILNNPQANKPIGTGPFMFSDWKSGQYILLERNASYWREVDPGVERFIALYVPDAATRTAIMEAGDAHIAGFGALYYADVRRLEAIPNFETTTKGYELISPVVEIHVNTRQGPLSDVRVRKAISYAIDRQFVIDNIWFGFGRKATGPLNSDHKVSGLYTSDVFDYDVADRLERAASLLDEAGYEKGADGFRFEVTIDPLPFGEEWRRFGEYVQQALQQVGVKANLRAEDFTRWLQRVYNDYDFDLALSWVSNLADPVIGTHREFHSSSIRKGAYFSNASGWSSKEADALMDAATIEPDPNKRAELYHSLQKLIVDEVPTIFVLELLYTTTTDRNLKDVVVGPLGLYQNLAGVRWA